MKKKQFYRLVLTEDDSHKRIGAYRFSRLSISVTLGSVLILLSGIIYCIIAFTPIRTTIPGYPDAYSKKQAIENAIAIDSLENIITRWEMYAGNLAHVLSGEQTMSLDSLIEGNATKYIKEIELSQTTLKDSLLREKIHNSEKNK